MEACSDAGSNLGNGVVGGGEGVECNLEFSVEGKEGGMRDGREGGGMPERWWKWAWAGGGGGGDTGGGEDDERKNKTYVKKN